MNLNGEKGDFYQLVWKSDDLKQRQATLSSIVEYARSQEMCIRDRNSLACLALEIVRADES